MTVAVGVSAIRPCVVAGEWAVIAVEEEADHLRRLDDVQRVLDQRNRLVHPPVGARQARIIAEIAQRDPQAIVVVAAAILVETGSYKRFDRLIVVTCTLEQQIERAMKRGPFSREEVLARLSRQLPLAEKVRLADFVIDTSSTKENTLEQVQAVYNSLRSLSV